MRFRTLFHSDIKAVGNNNLNLISWNKYKGLYSLFEIIHELPRIQSKIRKTYIIDRKYNVQLNF